MASFLGTVLGTMARLPSEVLKQRLQANLYDNVGGTWKQEGSQAFFRGAGATLCRELPFYVAGMGLYTESKKVFIFVFTSRFFFPPIYLPP